MRDLRRKPKQIHDLTEELLVEISARYSSLTAGADQMSVQERKLIQEMEELHAGLTRLGAGWTGEAERAFNVSLRVFLEELRNLSAVLGRTGVQLGHTQAAYSGTDIRLAARTESF